MKNHIQGLALLFGILAPLLMAESGQQISVARIARRNGEVIEGVVRGLVVLQAAPQEKRADGSKAYSFKFFTVNGKDIEKIDREGVHFRSGSPVGVGVAVHEQHMPDLTEVLATWVKNPPPDGFGGLWLKRTPSGALITLGNRQKTTAINGTIVGEFRMSDHKGILIPAIEVSTAQGIVTIRVDELPRS